MNRIQWFGGMVCFVLTGQDNNAAERCCVDCLNEVCLQSRSLEPNKTFRYLECHTITVETFQKTIYEQSVRNLSFKVAGGASMKREEEGEEDFEWEEWNPSRISFFNHMIAGSAAGLAEHVSVFPIDTLKTHIQCERCGSMSPGQTWNCATRIVGREGIFRLWRGVSATFAGCLPGASNIVKLITCRS